MSDATQVRLEQVQNDIADIKSLLGEMAKAVSKFAVLEERHQHIAQTTNNILERVQRIEDRQHQVELSLALNSGIGSQVQAAREAAEKASQEIAIIQSQFRLGRIFAKAAWALVGGGVLYILARMFLLGVI